MTSFHGVCAIVANLIALRISGKGFATSIDFGDKLNKEGGRVAQFSEEKEEMTEEWPIRSLFEREISASALILFVDLFRNQEQKP